jgi:hypothetical protein
MGPACACGLKDTIVATAMIADPIAIRMIFSLGHLVWRN